MAQGLDFQSLLFKETSETFLALGVRCIRPDAVLGNIGETGLCLLLEKEVW